MFSKEHLKLRQFLRCPLDLHDRGHSVHLPRITQQRVHSAHRGHYVSGVFSSGSRIYLGGDDVMVAVALRGMSPRWMGPESWGTVTDMEVYRFQAEGHSVFSPKVTSKVFPGVTLTFTDRIS
jgi:hypothetical protein